MEEMKIPKRKNIGCFRNLFSNLLRRSDYLRYAVTSSTKKISEDLFNQFYITKNYQLFCPLSNLWDLCISYT